MRGKSKRTIRVEILLTPEEDEAIGRRSRQFGFRKRPDYLRAAGLGLHNPIEAAMAAEIGRIRIEISRLVSGRAALQNPEFNEVVELLEGILSSALARIRNQRGRQAGGAGICGGGVRRARGIADGGCDSGNDGVD